MGPSANSLPEPASNTTGAPDAAHRTMTSPLHSSRHGPGSAGRAAAAAGAGAAAGGRSVAGWLADGGARVNVADAGVGAGAGEKADGG
jgi:hypothetical protein